tara:strand:- start:458 stop:1291 length:834 start_codon:yes stop_codon:yes gene_type:complete
MDIITILTVNYNDTYFKHSLFHALDQLTFNKFKVIVCDNGSNKNQFTELKNLSKKYSFVEIITNIQSQTSSYGHGEALNLLIKKAETKYTLVIDGDALPLAKNWDRYLIDELNSGIKIIGATNPKERSGKRHGLGNFPLPCFAFFETEVFKKLNINNLPGNISEGQDVCWEWPVKFSKQNYKSKVFETKNTRDYKEGPLSSLVGVEEYYNNVNGKKILFAAHFGRGASGGINKLVFKSKYLSKLNRFFYLFFFIYSLLQKKKWNKIINSLMINNQHL